MGSGRVVVGVEKVIGREGVVMGWNGMLWVGVGVDGVRGSDGGRGIAPEGSFRET